MVIAVQKRARFLVRGRVQGVCYRMAAQEEAMRLNVTGWVRNMRSGEVEIVAEGSERSLSALLDWCRSGPPLAGVTGVEAEYSRPTGEFASFTIKYGAGL